MADISATTQAILLLVAPLLAGGRTEANLLLKPTEYTRLVHALQRLDCQPGELLGQEAAGILAALKTEFDRGRIERLLSRGMQLGLALEHWAQCSIQVISRADASYPRRLKQSLGHRSPSLLYCCGEVDLLHGGGLAVVGSRKVDQELLTYTRKVGALAAAAGCTIVSGGAKGVDQASMQGAAVAGGQVIGVLANNLERAVLNRDNRNALVQQKLLLCSPFDPAAEFQAWRAMDRNKLIYALSHAALVVQSDVGRGGTWSGAKEQIQRFRSVPVYTRTRGPRSHGLQALRDLGAYPWPEPDDVDEFRAIMETPLLADRLDEVPVSRPEPPVEPTQRQDGPTRSDTAGDTWAAELWDKVAELIWRLLEHESLSADAVAQALKVGRGQARSWLEQLVEADKLVKTSRPVRYQRNPSVPQIAVGQNALALAQNSSVSTLDEASTESAQTAPDSDRRNVTENKGSMWATELRAQVEEWLLRVLEYGPLSSQDVATFLELRPGQAQSWLQQMAVEGKLTKTSNPVRYQATSPAPESENCLSAATHESNETNGSTQGQLLPPQVHMSGRATHTAPLQNTAVWAGELRKQVEDLLLKLLTYEALPVKAIAQTLRVSPSQARHWLDSMVEAGKLSRTSRPVRYQRHTSDQQTRML